MSEPARPTNIRWLIILMLVAFAYLAHFNRVSISVAANANFIAKDPATAAEKGLLSPEQIGVIYSTFLFVYTLGMLPGGWIIDRIGIRWSMTLLGLGFGFLTLLTAFLGWSGMTIAALFWPLLLIRGIAGFTSVTLHPGAARSVSLWLPPSQRFAANGLVNAGALVGIASTYPLFGYLMQLFGWQMAFVISASALMLLGVAWFALSRDDPSRHPLVNEAECQLVHGNEPPPSRSKATLKDVLGLFQNRGLVLLTLSYGAIGYVQYMFFYWIEFYFGKVLNVPETESRTSAFIINISMAVGMAFGGAVSNLVCVRFGQNVGCRIVAMVGITFCSLFSIVGVLQDNPTVITALFSLSFASLGLCEGIFWTAAPQLEKRNGGLACAMLNTGGNAIGLLAPIFTPIIGEKYGWTVAIVFAGGLCTLGGLLWFGIRVESPAQPKTAKE